MLVDLTNKNITGKVAQNVLDEVGITANKNTIPFEKLSPFVTSGIRLGSPALTTRGFKEDDMVDSILAIYDTEVMDDSTKTPLVEVTQDSTIKSYYMFDIVYELTENDNTFDDIKASLVKLIRQSISDGQTKLI